MKLRVMTGVWSTLLFLAAVFLMVSLPAGAATYRITPKMADLAVSADELVYASQPDIWYNLEAGPQVLKFGYDVPANLVWETVLIFDLNGLPARTGLPLARLYLSPLTWAGATSFWLQHIPADHPTPELADFDWMSKYGDVIAVCDQPTGLPSYDVGWALGNTRYCAWALVENGPLVQITGSGAEAPYLEFTTVPEPSSCASLGLAVIFFIGLLVGPRRRRRALTVLLAATLLPLLLAGAARADDDWVEIDSPPGSATHAVVGGPPAPATVALPSDYKYLPAFPRFFWSYGCVPTSGAMVIGYYDNAGFPRMCRYDDSTDYVCPTGNYPSDNKMFLKSGDSLALYPSRCAISASEQGVLGRTTRGHVDDYYWVTARPPGVSSLDPYMTYQVAQPHWIQNWPPHTDDCVGDFMGASIKYWRGNNDGGATIFWQTPVRGMQYRWVPGTYPFPNVKLQSGDMAAVDSLYGLSEYIVHRAGYHSSTKYATDQTSFDAVADYYTQTVNGYDSTTYGVVPQDVANEIDAGRPVIAVAIDYSGFQQHAFPVFGYKWTTEVGGYQRLWLLGYDTWAEDVLGYETTPYREARFQKPDEVSPIDTNTADASFERKSVPTYWRIYAFSFLKVNNNARCPVPFGTNDYPNGVYDDSFDIAFNLPGNSRVHYSGSTPTPASPAVTLDGNGAGTLTIDRDCAMNFRTYRDATAPEDGYLASDVVKRVYSVFSANKNVKKQADGASVTMVNGVVTHVVDADNFYIEERDKRIFGIRVYKQSHGLSRDDEVQVVVGSIETDSTNSERYITASSITTPSTTKVMAPFCMDNEWVGGADYAPLGGSGTGYGQVGVTNGKGTNNVGLLVNTSGVVTCIAGNSSYITISDGSGAVDSGSNDGVKILCAGLIPSGVDVGSFVTATGICSMEEVDGDLYPVIIARTSADLIKQE